MSNTIWLVVEKDFKNKDSRICFAYSNKEDALDKADYLDSDCFGGSNDFEVIEVPFNKS